MSKPNLTDEQLAELERLANAATPGPWRKCNASGGKCMCRLVWSLSADVPVASATDGNATEFDDGRHEDAAFIAAANPQAVKTLIADLRAARADLRETKSNLCEARRLLDRARPFVMQGQFVSSEPNDRLLADIDAALGKVG